MRSFDDTDPCEDTGDAHVSGHNGSFKRWVPEPSTPAPCPAPVRAHLDVLKAEMRGQCLARRAAWGAKILAGV